MTNIEEFFSSVLFSWSFGNTSIAVSNFFSKNLGKNLFLFLFLLEMETEILIISGFSGLHRLNFGGRINLT